MKYLKNIVPILLITSLISLATASAYASAGKEFTTSVIYGTLAGTLVGAATLAFTSNPGDNLQNVARGASYGLYAGMLLGLYVAYGLSDPEPAGRGDERAAPENLNAPPPPQNQNQNGGEPEAPQSKIENKDKSFRYCFYPILNPQNPQDFGMAASVIALKF